MDFCSKWSSMREHLSMLSSLWLTLRIFRTRPFASSTLLSNWYVCRCNKLASRLSWSACLTRPFAVYKGCCHLQRSPHRVFKSSAADLETAWRWGRHRWQTPSWPLILVAASCSWWKGTVLSVSLCARRWIRRWTTHLRHYGSQPHLPHGLGPCRHDAWVLVKFLAMTLLHVARG